MIYSEFWRRNVVVSALCYLRDLLVQSIPFRVPCFLRSLLYGGDIRFIFVVHPRRKEDIFIAAPFLGFLRRFLPSGVCYRIIENLPPSVLCTVSTSHGIKGAVVFKLILPESMLVQRRKCLRDAYAFVNFASKISKSDSFIGLGGWWPIVTKRGAAVQGYARRCGLKLTNGHCGTLCSIFLMLEKIASISNIPLNDLRVLIIGAGKMGSNVIRILRDRVKQLTIIERNSIKATRMLEEFIEKAKHTQMRILTATDNSVEIGLRAHHVCVCTTSNLRRIIKPEHLPCNTLVIDDSRPEAFPRICDSKKKIAILEGGLMKILGARCDYDFGFGQDQNFFGCLVEVFILALEATKQKRLKVTSGDVDEDNFWSMLNFCKNNSIEVGDFKTSNHIVNIEFIRQLIRGKAEGLSSRDSVLI